MMKRLGYILLLVPGFVMSMEKPSLVRPDLRGMPSHANNQSTIQYLDPDAECDDDFLREEASNDIDLALQELIEKDFSEHKNAILERDIITSELYKTESIIQETNPNFKELLQKVHALKLRQKELILKISNYEHAHQWNAIKENKKIF